MTRKQRPSLALVEPPRAESNVVPIRRVPGYHAAVPVPAPATAPRRETTWRDLVRRLVNNLAKR